MPFNLFSRNPFEREPSRLPSYVYDPLDVVSVTPQGDVMRRGLDRSIQSEADAFQRVEELLASLSQGKAGDVLRPVIGLFERAREGRAILPEAIVSLGQLYQAGKKRPDLEGMFDLEACLDFLSYFNHTWEHTEQIAAKLGKRTSGTRNPKERAEIDEIHERFCQLTVAQAEQGYKLSSFREFNRVHDETMREIRKIARIIELEWPVYRYTSVAVGVTDNLAHEWGHVRDARVLAEHYGLDSITIQMKMVFCKQGNHFPMVSLTDPQRDFHDDYAMFIKFGEDWAEASAGEHSPQDRAVYEVTKRQRRRRGR